MLAAKQKIRKVSALLMSLMLSVSLFPSGAAMNADAFSYSEMSALDSQKYTGDDLGANYTKEATTFKVWAPTASDVKLKRYKTGSDSEAGAGLIETKNMTKGTQGIWSVTVSGDLANTYYTYVVTANGATHETVDIYARTTGVNGMRGMVIDLDSTDPVGWESDKRVNCDNQTDAVIWEAHVRDFSSSSDSGMKNKGKYLAFTETGTTVNSDGVHPTGIDYLADLGVTHVHLLPVYDYASVDETKLDTDQFNWGYDPMNYNTPEGSYSTDPYNGSVRVKEFKQMVQALHKKNIGVVMDVVYNHTYAGGSNKNDWFDFTVPGYYYRQDSTGKYSNASGCGNETASDRAMYQKYMIDSLKYWATEYHLDGFRFDLMGIHDVDTMNKIRQELDKIDPDILIYGEPWTAAATPCPKATAVQSNMKLVSEEIAAFNDKVRDAIKGSCFNASDPGFIQGASGMETSLKGGIQANSTDMAGTGKWSKQPSQTVTYTSAHDNYTLYDKLVKSVKGGSGYGNRYDDLVAMNKMAGGIILTSQGMSFFQAGEEFARSKGGDENSYKSPTSVNQLKWQNTVTYADIVSYYKGLIEIRKAYTPFRDPTNTSNNTIYFSWGTNCPDKVVAFTMYNKVTSASDWNYVAVIHNANTSQKTVTLQSGSTSMPSQWVIIANGSKAGTVSLGTTGSTVTVPARSTMVLVDKTSFDSVVIGSKSTVTVEHILKENSQTYKTEKLTGKEGDSYTTSPLAELLNSGYKVVSTSGETSGKYTTGNISVKYYYELDKTKYGTVTVKYQNADTGAEVAPSETHSGLIGSNYTYSPKEISGFECDTSLTTNATGVFASTPITVIFKYKVKEVQGCTVHYYNSSNWPKVSMYVYSSTTPVKEYTGAWPGTAMKEESGGWYTGTIANITDALFIANNGGAGEQDPAGVGTPGYKVGEGEYWIKSGKVYPTGKVNVEYVSTDGTKLASLTLKGMADGTNTYTTQAKTFDGYELTANPSNATGKYTAETITVKYVYKPTVTPDPLENKSSLSASTVAVNKSVTVKAAASGGSGTYTFAVSYKKSTDTSWTTKQDFSSNTSISLSFSEAGSYKILVNAKDSAGKTADKTLSLTVTSDNPLVNKATVSPETVEAGGTVTVKCAASGGTSPYKFAVYYKKSSDTKWAEKQNYSTNTSVKITLSKAVKYDVCVKVKDSKSVEAKKYFTINVTSGALKNKSTVSSEKIALGSSVTVNCSATGGAGSYKYAVYLKKTSETKWAVKQDFKTNASVKLQFGHAVKYDVCVKVKDGSSKIEKRYFVIDVYDNNLNNTSKLSATSITLGGNVKVTASAKGGSGSYKYAVYFKKASESSWATVQDFKSNNTVTITPGHAVKYNICVKVKDGTGNLQKKYMVLNVDPALNSKSKISAETISLGKSVVVTGAASGGSGSYKYAVYYKKTTDSKWATSQDFSTNNKVSITPAKAVAYDICVKVKDGNGMVVKDYYTVYVR